MRTRGLYRSTLIIIIQMNCLELLSNIKTTFAMAILSKPTQKPTQIQRIRHSMQNKTKHWRWCVLFQCLPKIKQINILQFLSDLNYYYFNCLFEMNLLYLTQRFAHSRAFLSICRNKRKIWFRIGMISFVWRLGVHVCHQIQCKQFFIVSDFNLSTHKKKKKLK